MRIRVAQYIADFLVEYGIEHNFTVTGGGAMHLNDALGHKEGLKSIYNHHEQASAIAAEAYSRLTGKLACLCVTSGPGGTNAITGVVGGWLDSIPMLILSGQVKREMTISRCPELSLRQLGDQEFDITSVVKNFTKYSVMITEANDIADGIALRCFFAAFHQTLALFLRQTSLFQRGTIHPIFMVKISIQRQGVEFYHRVGAFLHIRKKRCRIFILQETVILQISLSQAIIVDSRTYMIIK